MIEVLSAAKADVHYTKSGSGETALYYACLQGRLAAVKALLAADSRHSDALFDNQETPLHCCAMGGHAQVVTELLKAGAKHGATKSDGATPLCAFSAEFVPIELAFILVSSYSLPCCCRFGMPRR